MTTETTTDMITAEEAEKLLDGTTPGLTDHCLYHCGKRVAECPCMRDLAAKHALATAAPDLARTVIALHAQLADAQAAQAMVRDRAEKAEAERVSEWNKRRDADSSRNVARAACDTMRADRDRLAAANAVLEAKVAGLVEAVKPFDAVGGTLFSKNWNMSDIVFDGGPMRSDCLFFEDFLNLRAALATQEAGT